MLRIWFCIPKYAARLGSVACGNMLEELVRGAEEQAGCEEQFSLWRVSVHAGSGQTRLAAPAEKSTSETPAKTACCEPIFAPS